MSVNEAVAHNENPDRDCSSEERPRLARARRRRSFLREVHHYHDFHVHFALGTTAGNAFIVPFAATDLARHRVDR